MSTIGGGGGDLRTRAPALLGRPYVQLVNDHPAVPGIKVPIDHVDSRGVLRIQGAFDALDKAASLLARLGGNNAALFKRLLRARRRFPA